MTETTLAALHDAMAHYFYREEEPFYDLTREQAGIYCGLIDSWMRMTDMRPPAPEPAAPWQPTADDDARMTAFITRLVEEELARRGIVVTPAPNEREV
jgi:hypothetical protein